MTEFKDGDITYAIDFRIATIELKGIQHGFDAVQKNRMSYNSNKVYKTKNEAIEAVINQLQGLKE